VLGRIERAVGGGYYGIVEYVEEAKRQGIRILGPDANRSSAEFEVESGLLEGTGEAKCLSFGSPPACCLRGEVRSGGGGSIKVLNCTFLKSF
jgi:DNA polymerase III alpha subunit